MAIQVGGVTVITNNRVLQNVSGVGGGLGSTFSTVSNVERANNFNSAQSFTAGTWFVSIKNRNNTGSYSHAFGTPNNVRGGYIFRAGNAFEGGIWNDTNNQWRWLNGSSSHQVTSSTGMLLQGGQGYSTNALISFSGTTNFNNAFSSGTLMATKINNV